MVFKLPELDYAYTSLEPHLDAKTLEIHHSKHHKSYLDKLNVALENYPAFYEKSIEDILMNLQEVPNEVRLAVRNNGGGYYHHNLFWKFMTPNEEERNFEGVVAAKIEETFGSFEEFKLMFDEAALGLFGSGWSWLVVNSDGQLEIVKTHNQDSPITDGKFPILGIDVWEHAYYLKFKNKRGDYLEEWWSVVNWVAVNDFYVNALQRIS